MAASAPWSPQEEGFKEICGLLEQQISHSSSADKSQIWQQLQHYSQLPDFNNYLVFILARAEVLSSFPLNRRRAEILVSWNAFGMNSVDILIVRMYLGGSGSMRILISFIRKGFYCFIYINLQCFKCMLSFWGIFFFVGGLWVFIWFFDISSNAINEDILILFWLVGRFNMVEFRTLSRLRF